MFGNIRDRFHTVHEGISASFRGLSVAESPRSKSSGFVNEDVDYNAGAETLHKFQSNWSKMHQSAEDNARRAEEVDIMIENLQRNIERNCLGIEHFSSKLASIPQLLNKVDKLMRSLGELQDQFEESEKALLNLEDIIETQELQEKQLDHRFQLALYKEKKLAEIKDLEKKMNSAHAEKVYQHEIKQQKLCKERHDAFEEAFQEDINQFKEKGIISTVERVKHSSELKRDLSLEDIDFETGNLKELDKFLNDDNETG